MPQKRNQTPTENEDGRTLRNGGGFLFAYFAYDENE